MVITLEPTRPGDESAIEAMARQIWPDAYAAILSEEQIDFMLGWMYSPDILGRAVADDTDHLYWIRRDGERVGFLHAVFAATSRTAKLEKLYLQRRHWGNGIARDALALLASECRSRDVERIELRVNRENSRAIRAYEKSDFRIISSHCLAIGDGFVMDDFIMARAL